jgi:2-polyprenyl-3-methyl-5-hydroxy-6-metoxy-1,4-benzoquinol methylase
MKAKTQNAIDHFDERAKEWNSLYDKSVFKQRLELFIKSVNSSVPANNNILDFGCGGGMIAINLEKDSDYSVTAVDASHEMIINAEKLASEYNSKVKFNTIDQYGNDLPSETYDAIICSSVIEYVKHDSELLDNLSRSLKPNGHLFISIPNARSALGIIEDFLKSTGLRKIFGKEPDVEFAHKRYSISEFSTLLTNSGLTLLDTTSFECPILGDFGTFLSKSKLIGIMLLVHAKKQK